MAAVSAATGDAVVCLSINGKAGGSEQVDDVERQRLGDDVQDQSEDEEHSERETVNDNEGGTDNESDNDCGNNSDDDSKDDGVEYVREGVFDFFGLPAEIRYMVYDYACTAPPYRYACLAAVNLTKTSRKVRSEVLPMMFEHLSLFLWLDIKHKTNLDSSNAKANVGKFRRAFAYGHGFLTVHRSTDRYESTWDFLSRLRNVEVRMNDAWTGHAKLVLNFSFPKVPLSLPQVSQVSVETPYGDAYNKYAVLLKDLLDTEFQSQAGGGEPLCFSKDFSDALTSHLEHVARTIQRERLRR